MSRRHRILIAIEKAELSFWSAAQDLLRWAQVRSAGTQSSRDLSEALRWADDAARARRGEIAYLTRKARAEPTAPQSAPMGGVPHAA